MGEGLGARGKGRLTGRRCAEMYRLLASFRSNFALSVPKRDICPEPAHFSRLYTRDVAIAVPVGNDLLTIATGLALHG